MAQSYMSTSLLLRLFCSLLFLVPIYTSRAIDDGSYIRLPSSSANVTNFGAGDGGDSHEYSSSDILPEVQGAPNRKFLVLALSWPRSICKPPEVCLQVPRYFTIHGLWGNNPNERCPVIPFNTDLWKDHETLKTQLREYWVNAKAKSKYEYGTLSIALKFWEYEHKKHAGCTDLKQMEYFQKAIELILKYDVTKIVNDNFPGDISNTRRIDATKLGESIKTGLGGTPSMVCSANSACWLQEIRLYIRTSDWTVVDYNRPLSCAFCPNGVLFPINLK